LIIIGLIAGFLIALAIIVVFLIDKYVVKVVNDSGINLFVTVMQVINSFYGYILMIILLGYAVFNFPL